MIKVLHIIPQGPHMRGGSSVRSKNILKHQKKFVQPVAIVSPMFNKNQFPAHNPSVVNGIKYYYFLERRKFMQLLYRFRPLRSITTFIHRKEFKKYVYSIALTEKPHIVHAASPYTNGLAGLYVSMALRIPFVYEIRGLSDYDVRYRKGFTKTGLRVAYRKRLENTLLHSSDAIVVLSSVSKRDLILRNIPKDKIFIVPNGVESAFVNNYRKSTSEQILQLLNIKNRIIIGFIGFLKPVEDIICLIDAVSILVEQEIKDIIVLIIGEGPMLPTLRKYAESSGIEEYIKFLGNVPHEEIKTYYRALDIFVVPRIRNRMTETISPLKIIEAMAMEVPVIGSDVGGIKEVIKPGENGFLYKAEDPYSLAKQIRGLIDNRTFAKNVAKRARKWVLKDKKWEDIVGIYRNIYRRLLDENIVTK